MKVEQQDSEVTVANVYRGKNAQIVGALITIVGLFALMGSCSTNDSEKAPVISLLVVAVGLLVYMFGKVEHWYHAE